MKLLESQQKRTIDQRQKIGIDQQKMKINSKTHDQESTKQSESKQPMKPASSEKVG